MLLCEDETFVTESAQAFRSDFEAAQYLIKVVRDFPS